MNEVSHEVRLLDINAYQDEAAKTAIYPKELGLLYVALGLAGEAGEFANKVKKVLRDDGGQLTEARRRELMAELGDAMWYIAAAATELGVKLSFVADFNIQKLRLRQANGDLGGSGDER